MKEYKVTLTWNSTSLVLGYNPAGIDKIGIVLQRHEVYHSVLRSYTLSLRFLNVTHPVNGDGGYNFIKNAYNTNGINAIVECEIKRRNPNTDDYDSFYTGILDFTPNQWTDDRGLFWESALIDSSILQKFISRDENKIDITSSKTLDNITIAPATFNNINLTPVDIIVKTLAKCTHNYYLGVPTDYWQDYKWYLHDPTFTLNQCTNTEITGTDIMYINNDADTKSVSFNIDIIYRISVNCEATGNGNVVVTCTLRQYDSDDHLLSTNYVTLFTHPTTSGLNFFIEEGSSSLTVNDLSVESGGYLVVEFREVSNLISGSGYLSIQDYGAKGYTVYVKEKTFGVATTTAKSIFPMAAFAKSIEIITNESDFFDSSIMDTGGELEHDAILNGYQIRKYPTPKVNLTFRELFKTFDNIYNLGLWFNPIENKFIIENKDFFYQDTLLFDLGEVSKFKRIALNKAYFSKIIGGFNNEGDYEKVQGALEFAVKREYSTISTVKEELNIEVPYRLDSVKIEELRNLLYLDHASEDNDADNNIFIVKTNGTDPILPTVGSPEYLGMDVFYSYYNTMLSPRQNFLRWANIIKNCHYKNTSDFKAQETLKQYELEIDGIDENSDIAMSELGTSLFIPELHSIESFLTRENLAILLANPHGYFRYSYNGEKFEGYIEKAELSYNNTTVKIDAKPRNKSTILRIFEGGNNHLLENGNQKISE